MWLFTSADRNDWLFVSTSKEAAATKLKKNRHKREMAVRATRPLPLISDHHRPMILHNMYWMDNLKTFCVRPELLQSSEEESGSNGMALHHEYDLFWLLGLGCERSFTLYGQSNHFESLGELVLYWLPTRPLDSYTGIILLEIMSNNYLVTEWGGGGVQGELLPEVNE